MKAIRCRFAFLVFALFGAAFLLTGCSRQSRLESALDELGKGQDSSAKIVEIVNTCPNETQKQELRTLAIGALISDLTKSSSSVRIQAAYCLGEIQSDSAKDALIHGLSDGDANVRSSSQTALIKYGDQAVVKICSILNEINTEQHRPIDPNSPSTIIYSIVCEKEIISIAGEIKCVQAISSLLGILDNCSPEIRTDICSALSKIGIEKMTNGQKALYYVKMDMPDKASAIGSDAIIPLINSLTNDAVVVNDAKQGAYIIHNVQFVNDFNHEYISNVCLVLKQLGRPAIIELINHLNDKKRNLAACAVLQSIGINSLLELKDKLNELNLKNLNDLNLDTNIQDDITTRALVVYLIKDLHDPRSCDALLGLLKIEDDGASCLALDALSDGCYDKAIDPLIVIMDSGNKFCMNAAETLSNYHNERVILALINALDNDYPNIRNRIALLLSKQGTPAIATLIDAMENNSGNHNILYGIALALGDIGKPAADSLIQCMFTYDSNLQNAAQYALSVIGEPAVKPLIDKYSKNDAANAIIGHALARIGKPAVKPVIALLWSDNSNLVLTAIRTLEKIGDPDAIEPLYVFATNDRLISHLGEGYQNAAFDAIDEIRKKQVQDKYK